MKADLWKLLHPRWRTPVADPKPGYSALLLMPGDLPFFLDIIARVFADKQSEHLVEALVIPDMMPAGFAARFDRFAKNWRHGDVRLVTMPPADRLLARMVKNPHANCWLQLVNGVNASRATHALWHDADLFVSAPEFFDEHYRKCANEGLACLGVGPAWDPWLKEHGLGHITATWEMIYDQSWLRSFKPWQHRGHEGTLPGHEPHIFDISFLPQALTPPDRIGRHDQTEHFVHFNYVICTYRWFQQSRGPYEDEHFRILLIRLLIDAFDPGGWNYEAPPLAELTRGLGDRSSRVTYANEATAGNYAEFRTKLQKFLDGPFLDGRQIEVIESGVRPFDRAFGDVHAAV